MPQLSLDSLVAALATSVAEAEHIVRVHQVRNLRSFFNDDNEPVTVDLKVPSLRGDARADEMDDLTVPLITLVNVSQMSIAEMEVKFSTELGDLSERGPAPEVDDGPTHFGGDADEREAEQDRDDLGWTEDRQRMAIDVTTSPTTAESGRATVTLRVRQAETPEGLARLITRLNRSL